MMRVLSFRVQSVFFSSRSILSARVQFSCEYLIDVIRLRYYGHGVYTTKVSWRPRASEAEAVIIVVAHRVSAGPRMFCDVSSWIALYIVTTSAIVTHD